MIFSFSMCCLLVFPCISVFAWPRRGLGRGIVRLQAPGSGPRARQDAEAAAQVRAVEPPPRAEFRLWAAAETGPTSHRGREGGCPLLLKPEAPRPGLFWVAPSEFGGQAQNGVLGEGKEAVPGNWAAQTGSSFESCAKSLARDRKSTRLNSSH